MSQLTKVENRWAAATFGTIYPGVEQVPSINGMGLAGFLGELGRFVPFKAFFGLRLALFVIAFAPLFVLGKLKTIAGLSTEDRERVITRLAYSKSYVLRQLVMMIKAMGALLYGAHPQVQARARRARQQPKTELVALRLKRPEAA